MKKFFAWIATLLIFLQFLPAQAAKKPPKPSATVTLDRSAQFAVMDFGGHYGASDVEENMEQVGTVASDYIIETLIEKNINVVDKEIISDKIEEENLDTTGTIDQDSARRIGELLGARYIIYGNIVDIALDEDQGGVGKLSLNLKTVKAHVMTFIMDVNDGKILMAAKGSGESKSSHVDEAEMIQIGTVKVSKESVHNSVERAAANSVEILFERCKLK